MTTLTAPAPPRLKRYTAADLLSELGDIPARRVWINPPVGTATERELLDLKAKENRLFELVDGTLVEKAMSFRASLLAGVILELLRIFNRSRNLGLVTGADGMVRLFPNIIRIPDVAFVSWARVPGQVVPSEPVPSLVPDLAVEVLSDGNTPAEMTRKRGEYFEAGVKVVWEVDADLRTVTVYTSPQSQTILRNDQILPGGEILPGFELRLSELFAELDVRGSGAR